MALTDPSDPVRRHPDAVSPIVPVKIRIPRIEAMRRDRLLALLHRAWDHRLITVVAPAGAGKTTFLAQFAESARAPVAWYSAERDDGDAETFLAHIEWATRAATGNVEGPWTDPAGAARALEQLRGERLLLVIDDLHVLVDTPAEAALGRLLRYMPDGVVVAAAGRIRPGLELSELRVTGRLLEIEADALRFRSWEVEYLFRDHYGEPLPPEELAQLTRRTEGWPAGLQLFHLATRGKSPDQRSRTLASLATQSRLVREYLARNVLDDLDEGTRRFLLRTSVLGRMNGRLCDDLLGMRGSGAVLADLERQQLFTMALDDDGWYRYHEVLRSRLEAILVEESGEEAVREMRRAAGRILESAGAFSDALEAYWRGEHWEAATRLLRARGTELVAEPNWVHVSPPPTFGDDPWVMLAGARRMRGNGRWSVAVALYRRAEEAFAGSAPADLCRRERLSIAAWLGPFRAQPLGWPEQLRLATIRQPLLLVHAAGDTAGPRLVAGLAALLAGHVRFGSEILRAFVAENGPGPAMRACAQLALGVALWLAGDPLAAANLDAASEVAEQAFTPWLAGLALACRWLADDSSEQPVPTGPESLSLSTDEDRWGPLLLSLIREWRDVNRGAGNSTRLRDIADRLRATDVPVVELWVRALQALAATHSGETEAADLARDVETAARALGVEGAQAFALVARAHAEGATAYRHSAQAIGDICGLRLDRFPGPVDSADAIVDRPGRTSDTQTGGGRSVELSVFGTFTVRVDGAPLDLTTVKPKARSLLRLLALHADRPLHRETILADLWPDLDAECGMHNLHVAVSSLRRLLLTGAARGSGALLARDGDCYRLCFPADAVDAMAFEAGLTSAGAARSRGDVAAAAAALESTLSIYSGDLLAEEGPAEWVLAERDRFRIAAAGAALQLGRLRFEAGRFACAVEATERGLRIDRYSDPLWQLLIEIHDRTGAEAAAAHARQRYAAILEELGCPASWSGRAGTPAAALRDGS